MAISTPAPSDKLAALIRERRRANVLPQQELSEKIGVAQPTISMWEKGKSRPDHHQLKKLESILGSMSGTSEATTEAGAQAPMAAWVPCLG